MNSENSLQVIFGGKRKWLVLVLMILFLGSVTALCFIRDFIFVQTNIVLFNLNNQTHYEVAFPVDLLMNCSYWTVYWFKWILTAVSCTVFYFLQQVFITIIFSEKNMIIWLRIFYLVLILLGTFAFFFGYLIGNMDKGYLYCRVLLGLLQSPIPFMIVVPSWVAFRHSKEFGN